MTTITYRGGPLDRWTRDVDPPLMRWYESPVPNDLHGFEDDDLPYADGTWPDKDRVFRIAVYEMTQGPELIYRGLR